MSGNLQTIIKNTLRCPKQSVVHGRRYRTDGKGQRVCNEIFQKHLLMNDTLHNRLPSTLLIVS